MRFQCRTRRRKGKLAWEKLLLSFEIWCLCAYVCMRAYYRPGSMWGDHNDRENVKWKEEESEGVSYSATLVAAVECRNVVSDRIPEKKKRRDLTRGW
ncbi:hypothetical protein L228DRAFT_52340 [Xylona heveae TC161]|uniref:Uncharacterized protein n=1 Tax=Xylona heveae (strain CBS 132557 / TC161) TaxID=1328760 RepID=A0A164ZER1_XYLHT|nr:hypothetical protein L228DRAFT_52340 [Xylona heveae TC161]KZF19010.1 hypothetical protein L228DRAFT_52340 [Xylona heveae TC161]